MSTAEISQSETNGTAIAPRRSSAMTSRGVSFGTVADLWNFAGMVAKSGLAPKGMDKPEAITVAIQMGLEIGLSPMASLQNIAVINGRPSLCGDAMLAVCRNSGVFCEESFSEETAGEGDARTATCTVRRAPKGKPYKATFSVADAKRAGLWGKAGPWTQYPDRMLKMRARGFALRDTFGDFLRGMYSIEEVRDGFEDVETVREIPSYSSAPNKAAALAEQLKQRAAEAEPQTEQTEAPKPPSEAQPADSEPNSPGDQTTPTDLTAEELADWQKRIAACPTLTNVRALEDQAAAVPMPARQAILDMLKTRSEEIRAARGNAAEKGKLV